MHFLNQEQKLISKITALLGSNGKFIGDDCAVLPDKMLLTIDSLIEQTHFQLDSISMNDLGWKAMAVNLSDIAAMAGKPQYAVVALSATPDFYASNKVIALYKGLIACATEYNTAIVGGNITRAPQLSITISAIGQAHQAGTLKRTGAKPKDVIIVTGDFGASAVGLQLSMNKSSSRLFNHCLSKHMRPIPRLIESWQLVKRIGNRGALMDTSDGLADALTQIAQSSHVGMRIDLNAIPIHKQTRKFATEANLDPYQLALYGGEDYELVACLSEKTWQNWQAEDKSVKANFKQIGVVDHSNNIQLMFGNEIAHKLDLKQVFQHIF